MVKTMVYYFLGLTHAAFRSFRGRCVVLDLLCLPGWTCSVWHVMVIG